MDVASALSRSWGIWIWRPALEIAGALTLLLILFNVTDGDLAAVDIVSPVMIGISVLLVIASILSLREAEAAGRQEDRRWAAEHPWQFAILPALIALVTLLPIRLVSLAFDVDGPWGGLWGSVLDILFRVVVVYGIVGLFGAYSRGKRAGVS